MSLRLSLANWKQFAVQRQNLGVEPRVSYRDFKAATSREVLKRGQFLANFQNSLSNIVTPVLIVRHRGNNPLCQSVVPEYGGSF